MPKIHRAALAAGFAITTAATTAAVHAADQGFYVGLGTGQMVTADYVTPGASALFDEKSTPWRGFVGYRLGLIPILDFALEGGYRSFGTAKATVGGVASEYKTSGFDGALLAIFPLLGFDLFGKAGVLRYDLDRNWGGNTSSFNGTAPMYGVGAGFRVWRVGVRVEYERFEVDQLKGLDGAMVSATFRF
ncbi:MAG: outer membrane beta-barrel protein [Betaproteobacteria bacterium]|jgi:hypothetical protein|nr:outer membrane beta-barrel protein [Rhodocyclaceae bacterium]MCA3135218.1 outer membrane beta-barrel protein [Rhodocyclaceae bacterium]MCA3142717.1 outer membrane beta-barrel protein [Rhodocyclaceae bacterium]MCA3145250.1 outer membrane beta-barrel protein [Rhodocyclaceae bacterium]MCE2899366.1 outer membrane beta-barrel protein [Betaproteobacteria bacterium]